MPPISLHNFVSFNTISNILRYVYEKPPCNNSECGRRGTQLPCTKHGHGRIIATTALHSKLKIT